MVSHRQVKQKCWGAFPQPPAEKLSRKTLLTATVALSTRFFLAHGQKKGKWRSTRRPKALEEEFVLQSCTRQSWKKRGPVSHPPPARPSSQLPQQMARVPRKYAEEKIR